MQMSPDPELLAMITSILVTILAVIGILAVITYIFSSLGFYTLAKRRGILHPGLAWVPVCGARWIMGSLADVTSRAAAGPLALGAVCVGALFALHRQTVLLSAEEGEARMLGVPVGKMRLAVLLAATLAVACVVSLTGLVSFVGLLAPHAARLLTRRSGPGVLLLSGLAGGVLLTGADILARSAAAAELPVSIFTSLLGAPVLVWLAVRGRGAA